MDGGWQMKRKVKQGAFAEVIRAYLASPQFSELSKSTQDGYSRYLRLAELPENLGTLPSRSVRPADTQRFLNTLADKYGAQQRAKIALKAVERFALVMDLVDFSLTAGTKAKRSRAGHKPWTEEQVELVRTHARPEVARAVTLAVTTGQRGSDLVRMRWDDLELVDGRLGINVVQQKTGRQLWVPFTKTFVGEINGWGKARNGLLLVHEHGLPFTRQQLSMSWERERDKNPKLSALRESRLVFHGLRATAVVRLRRAGASIPQIADMIGMSEAMVAHYARHSNQRVNAVAALEYLENVGRNKAAKLAAK
jgi:integrase